MRSDDLVPLLAQRPPPGVGFRQGRVLLWDTATSANAIDVAGAVVTDLPCISKTESAVLQAGDIVSILTLGEGAKTWFVLGRQTIAGAPATFIAQSPAYQPATSGWTINRDGSAEFQDLTARGDVQVNSLVAGIPGAERIELTPANFLRIFDASNQLVGEINVTEWRMVDPATGNYARFTTETNQTYVQLFSGAIGGHTVSPGRLHAENLSGTEPVMVVTSPQYDGGQRSVIRLFGEDSLGPALITLGALPPSGSPSGQVVVSAGIDMFIRESLTIDGTPVGVGPGTLTVTGDITWGATPAVTVQAATGAGDFGTTASAAYTATLTGGTTPGVAFVAPPSGKVMVMWSALCVNNTAGAVTMVGWEIRQGAVVGSGTVQVAASDDRRISNKSGTAASDDAEYGSSYLVTGLTAGDSYNIRQMFKVSAGTATYLNKRVTVMPVL